MAIPHVPHFSSLGDQPRSRLSVGVDLAAGRITLAGHLNRGTARHLLDAIRTLGVVHQVRWVIDASALSDCDEFGLRALGACYRTAVRRGVELRVVGTSGWLRTALIRLRLDPHVTDPRAAVTEPQHGSDRMYPLVKLSA